MSMSNDIIKDTYRLNEILHKNAERYYHSRILSNVNTSVFLPEMTKYSFNIRYGIKDLLTIAAITHSSLLFTGGTDTGKTALSKLAMNAFFGKEELGWHRIDVDIDFSSDSYADVDFGKITNGEKMSEGFYSLQPWATLPGLIADEINRGHAKQVNKLLHIFDKDISLPDGSRAKVGKELGTGKRYQFQIAAINEGKEYHGTFDIDKALRRRTIIEIPMDIFPLTSYDRLRLKKEGKRDMELNNKQSYLEEILRINNAIENMPQHPDAELFSLFLEQFDYCKNSFTGEKGGVGARAGTIRHVCSQPIQMAGESQLGSEVACRFLRTFKNELCPYVRALSPGVSQNLMQVSKGFAVLRATKFIDMMTGYINNQNTENLSYSFNDRKILEEALQKYTGTGATGEKLAIDAIQKYVSALELRIEDVEAALPFVGFSKIGMASTWVEKHYQGNKYEAVSAFLRESKKTFLEGLSKITPQSLQNVLEGKATDDELAKVYSYGTDENPWLMKTIESYRTGDSKDYTNARGSGQKNLAEMI